MIPPFGLPNTIDTWLALAMLAISGVMFVLSQLVRGPKNEQHHD